VVTDYQLPTPTRRQCCATGRELKAGERYFGVLAEEAGRFVRREYAPEAWAGPPEGVVGFWAGRVPAGDAPKRPPVDDETVRECFRRLDGATEPSRVSFRYVLALLLVRRKALRIEETRRDEFGEVMILKDKSGERHEVRDPGLAEADLAAVEDEVFGVLGWD
jgi:hypothetical protein